MITSQRPITMSNTEWLIKTAIYKKADAGNQNSWATVDDPQVPGLQKEINAITHPAKPSTEQVLQKMTAGAGTKPSAGPSGRLGSQSGGPKMPIGPKPPSGRPVAGAGGAGVPISKPPAVAGKAPLAAGTGAGAATAAGKGTGLLGGLGLGGAGAWLSKNPGKTALIGAMLGLMTQPSQSYGPTGYSGGFGGYY